MRCCPLGLKLDGNGGAPSHPSQLVNATNAAERVKHCVALLDELSEDVQHRLRVGGRVRRDAVAAGLLRHGLRGAARLHRLNDTGCGVVGGVKDRLGLWQCLVGAAPRLEVCEQFGHLLWQHLAGLRLADVELAC